MSIPLPKGPSSRLPSTRVDALWDADACKYRVLCRKVHVMRAASIIGYAQLGLLAFFTAILLYIYAQAVFNGPDDTMLELVAERDFADNELHYTMRSSRTIRRYMMSMVMAVGLQLSLVLFLLHGLRTGRRSLLLPFIVFATFAAFLAVFQMSYDYSHASPTRSSSAVFSHLVGILIHIWCIHVIWRAYCFLGDKKVAEHIGEQLQATSLAFSYEYAQPPAYAEAPPEKRPLSIS